MAVALLATPDELSGISEIEHVRTWAGLDEGVWAALNAHLGTAPNLRTLAVIPRISLHHALQTVRITITGGEDHLSAQLHPCRGDPSGVDVACLPSEVRTS